MIPTDDDESWIRMVKNARQCWKCSMFIAVDVAENGQYVLIEINMVGNDQLQIEITRGNDVQ